MLALVVVMACGEIKESTPPGWVVLDPGAGFKLHAPPDLRPLPGQAADSLAGRYANESLELSYDYGWYSDPLDDIGRPGYARESLTVSDREAWLVTFEGFAGLHVPHADQDRKLTVSVILKDPAAKAPALEMLHSLRFD